MNSPTNDKNDIRYFILMLINLLYRVLNNVGVLLERHILL